MKLQELIFKSICKIITKVKTKYHKKSNNPKNKLQPISIETKS